MIDFNPETGRGELKWNRHLRRPALSFNKLDKGLLLPNHRTFREPSMMRIRSFLSKFLSSVPERFGCAF
jgi:hypothetical protein